MLLEEVFKTYKSLYEKILAELKRLLISDCRIVFKKKKFTFGKKIN